MLKALNRPLPTATALLAGAVLVAAVTLYCLAYTLLAGRSESPIDGIVWASVNVLPWFAAFELAKRREGLGLRFALLATALPGSMLLHLLLEEPAHGLGHELVRRLPALLLMSALLWMVAASASADRRRASEPLDLPLPPSQIDWVSAAGNYVELHGRGRTLVHRASLASVAAELAPQGFVRIHRSTLVRRDAIARVRAVDLLLRDGTSLKLGGRYRSALRLGSNQTRPFVPAE